MHLENVLVHMINTQDIAIFKSQKDYARNKQKLSEYIQYAQTWQVLLVIFFYAAFTCDIILVLTLIVFFIRYQKTTQAMLTAFITMDMSNSGMIVQVIMIIVCILIAFIVMYYCCKKFRHMCTLFKYCFPFLPVSRIL